MKAAPAPVFPGACTLATSLVTSFCELPRRGVDVLGAEVLLDVLGIGVPEVGADSWKIDPGPRAFRRND
jgi:hypothetical protein